VRLAVIVLAHRHPAQLALLLSTLRHPQIKVYLHLDSVVDAKPFAAALETAGLLSEIALLPRFRSRWGGIEVVDATLTGLERALADGCQYYLLVSGQDFPLWPADEIVSFFARHPARSYVQSFALPDGRWPYDGRQRIEFYTYTVLGRRETCIPSGIPSRLSWKGRVLNAALRLRGWRKPVRRFPACASPFGGSQWWNLSRAAAAYAIGFVRSHPEYRRYHEHTLLADEVFFQSILLGTAFAAEHEIVNDSLRYMVWPGISSHPRTLVATDVPPARASGKPLARKFDLDVDGIAVRELARELTSRGEARKVGDPRAEDHSAPLRS
jgi:hypothetical protein